MLHPSTKTRRYAAALITSALALGACGGDDEEGESSSTTVAAPAAETTAATETSVEGDAATGTTDETATTEADTATTEADTATTEAAADTVPMNTDPIKIMVIGVLESEALSLPQQATGVEARAAAQNASGGVDGRQIEVLTCNDGRDPNETAICARNAVEENVVAVVGSVAFFGDNLVPILEEAGIPYVAPRQLSAIDSTSPVSFPIDGGAPANWGAAAVAIIEDGCSRIALASGEGEANDVIEDYVRAAAEAGGAEFTGRITVASGTPDVSPVVATAIADGAECLIPAVGPQDQPKFLTAVQQTGADLRIAATLSAVPGALLGQLGAAADGMVATDYFIPFSSENEYMAQFRDEMAAYDPETGLDFFGLKSWIGMDIVIQAATGLPTVDGPSLLEVLNGMTVDMRGIAGDIDFSSPNTDPGTERIFNTSLLPLVARDGVWVQDGEFFDVRELFFG